MKKVPFLIIVFVVSCFFTSLAGNGETMSVWGKVVDKTTLKPLSGVNISLENDQTGIGTITNKQGEFRLWNIPGDSSTLMISLNGYLPSTVEISSLTNSLEEITIIKLVEKSRTSKQNSNEKRLAFFKKKQNKSE